MARGTATIDFGATPTNEGSVVVAEASIASTSHVEPWVMGADTSSDNDANAHAAAGVFFRPVVSAINAGVGFTIAVTLIAGLVTGTFKIRWASIT